MSMPSGIALDQTTIIRRASAAPGFGLGKTYLSVVDTLACELAVDGGRILRLAKRNNESGNS